MPKELAENVAAWCGCVAGAIPAERYISGLVQAGLTSVVAVDDKADLNAYAKVDGQSACCSPAAPAKGALTIVSGGCCASDEAPTLHQDLAASLRRHDINEFAAGVKFYVIKPA